jgi:hypothetical protein
MDLSAITGIPSGRNFAPPLIKYEDPGDLAGILGRI